MTDPFIVPVDTFSIESMGFSRMNAQAISHDLIKRAAHILAHEGSVNAVAFLFTEKVCYVISAASFFRNSDTKNMLSFLLRKVAGESEILGVALINECWARQPTEAELRSGEADTSRPVSEHTNKKEAIVVQCEWYDGSKYMLMAKFTRKKEATGIEAIKLEEPSGSTDFEGRFSHLFPPTRSGGYYH